jgi:hypothetical protein
MRNSLVGTTTPKPAELLNVCRKSVRENFPKPCFVSLARFPAETNAWPWIPSSLSGFRGRSNDRSAKAVTATSPPPACLFQLLRPISGAWWIGLKNSTASIRWLLLLHLHRHFFQDIFVRPVVETFIHSFMCVRACCVKLNMEGASPLTCICRKMMHIAPGHLDRDVAIPFEIDQICSGQMMQSRSRHWLFTQLNPPHLTLGSSERKTVQYMALASLVSQKKSSIAPAMSVWYPILEQIHHDNICSAC